MKIPKLLIAGLVLGRYALRGPELAPHMEITPNGFQQWEYGFFVTGGIDKDALRQWGESNITAQTALQNWIQEENVGFLDIVNRLGRLGWELTGVNTTQQAPYVIYIFKRAMQPVKTQQPEVKKSA